MLLEPFHLSTHHQMGFTSNLWEMMWLKNNWRKYWVNMVKSKDFMFKIKDQIYLEEHSLTLIVSRAHKKLLRIWMEILQLGIVKWLLIILDQLTTKTQDKADKQEPFTLEISTGDLKNGKSKISSLSAVKLKESVFHKVTKEEAEVLDLFNSWTWMPLKELLKNQATN